MTNQKPSTPGERLKEIAMRHQTLGSPGLVRENCFDWEATAREFGEATPPQQGVGTLAQQIKMLRYVYHEGGVVEGADIYVLRSEVLALLALPSATPVQGEGTARKQAFKLVADWLSGARYVPELDGDDEQLLMDLIEQTITLSQDGQDEVRRLREALQGIANCKLGGCSECVRQAKDALAASPNVSGSKTAE